MRQIIYLNSNTRANQWKCKVDGWPDVSRMYIISGHYDDIGIAFDMPTSSSPVSEQKFPRSSAYPYALRVPICQRIQNEDPERSRYFGNRYFPHRVILFLSLVFSNCIWLSLHVRQVVSPCVQLHLCESLCIHKLSFHRVQHSGDHPKQTYLTIILFFLLFFWIKNSKNRSRDWNCMKKAK